jgi:hypothetical protein
MCRLQQEQEITHKLSTTKLVSNRNSNGDKEEMYGRLHGGFLLFYSTGSLFVVRDRGDGICANPRRDRPRETDFSSI